MQHNNVEMQLIYVDVQDIITLTRNLIYVACQLHNYFV